MNSVKIHIAKAENLIISEDMNGKQFEKIYPFSNENIAKCLSNFNLKEKDCLTVLGSGDQALDMFYHNAKTIDAFDINPLTKYYFYLKKAALMSRISYQEYLRFFCYEFYPKHYTENQEAFNEKTFNKLVPYLKDDNYTFWSSLFDTFNFNPLKIRKSNGLFTSDELPHQVLSQTTTYLNEENYYKLGEKASNININFLNSNIKNLEQNLTQQYDFIYLSNIIQYTNTLYENNILLPVSQNRINELESYKNIVENLATHLKENGQMVAGYLYEPDRNSSFRGKAIFDTQLRTSIFSEYTPLYFPSINVINFIAKYGFNSKSCKDSCLIYQKKK